MLPRLARAVKRQRPHLVAVAHADHHYTFTTLRELLAARGIVLECWSYLRFTSARRLPFAAWILTDFDRLHPWTVELATRLHDHLVAAGAPVLNDPRRFLPRTAFLRRLQREGINDFACWLPAFGERPERFPVFLRTVAAHRGVLSALLHDPAEAEEALARAFAAGHPICDLMFVEFAAVALPTGGYRKHACYRVGEVLVRGATVSDTDWVAKYGQLGVASEEDYRRDLAESTDDPHEPLLRRVFDLAGTRYGRVDFGIVGDRPQIYEMNTNPAVKFHASHPSEIRLQTQSLQRERLLAAFEQLVPGRSTPWRSETIDVRAAFSRRRFLRVPRKQP